MGFSWLAFSCRFFCDLRLVLALVSWVDCSRSMVGRGDRWLLTLVCSVDFWEGIWF